MRRVRWSAARLSKAFNRPGGNVIVLLNGAFGIGKTTVARALVRRIPGALLFDPEMIGVPLQMAARLTGRAVSDFQDLKTWRSWTVKGLRLAAMRSRVIVVPMAISNTEYLAEIRRGVSRFERELVHFCLVAPVSVVHARLRERGADAREHAWQFRRAAECCALHRSDAFATHVDASKCSVAELASDLVARLGAG